MEKGKEGEEMEEEGICYGPKWEQIRKGVNYGLYLPKYPS